MPLGREESQAAARAREHAAQTATARTHYGNDVTVVGDTIVQNGRTVGTVQMTGHGWKIFER